MTDLAPVRAGAGMLTPAGATIRLAAVDAAGAAEGSANLAREEKRMEMRCMMVSGSVR